MGYKKREDLYAAQKRHRIKTRAMLGEFLADKSCADCGERDPIVFEFDHRNPKEKFKSIARMLAGHYSWDSIHREIQKCDIRCANCHRRKSFVQLGGFGRVPKKRLS
jgi:5-methylcytosine-specific restriction endonuclease McrA